MKDRVFLENRGRMALSSGEPARRSAALRACFRSLLQIPVIGSITHGMQTELHHMRLERAVYGAVQILVPCAMEPMTGICRRLQWSANVCAPPCSAQRSTPPSVASL